MNILKQSVGDNFVIYRFHLSCSSRESDEMNMYNVIMNKIGKEMK